MDVIEAEASQLEIDEINERKSEVGPDEDQGSLEDSIREQGLIQPPVVRESGEGGYKVVVGQRRTLAAQAVGLGRIPVVVADWDDTKALQASISENVYGRDVSPTDRAAAIKKLIELTGWNITEIGEELGVDESTIRTWLERTNEEWKGTSVHVEPSEEPTEEQTEVAENVTDTDLQTIRTATDSKEERDRVVKKVADRGLARGEIREAKKKSENSDQSFEEAIDTISQERTQKPDHGMKVETRVTFGGKHAKALREAAKDKGTSEEGVVRDAIEGYLKSEGYI